MKYMQMNWTLI